MRANCAANARKVIPVLAVLAVLVLQGLIQAQTLNEVLDNVKSNELLYNNYDVRAIHTYRLGTALAPLPGVVVEERKEARTVIQ
jgi:hypothetical protein